jgi:hypothetical protein
MTHFLKTHGEALFMGLICVIGIILACVTGPTLDNTTIAQDGKTAYAAKD